MNKPRQLWIDAAKGFSIIFVVMGHSGDAAANHYLSWFRMPLFFMLSGLVFKPVEPGRYLGWAAKRTKGLMTPYFAYGLLIAAVLLLFNFNVKGFAENIARLLYGDCHLRVLTECSGLSPACCSPNCSSDTLSVIPAARNFS